MTDKYIDVLGSIALPSVSNREQFTITDRLEKIRSILTNEYKYIYTKSNLFRAFSLKSIKDCINPIIITSHADTVMKKQFSEYNEKADVLKGTYDNLIGNATNVCVAMDLRHQIPEKDIIYVFTAEEETGGAGIRAFTDYLKQVNLTPQAIISLDVTPDGFNKDCPFSFENYNHNTTCPFNDLTSAIGILDSDMQSGNYIPHGLPDEALMYNASYPHASFCIPIKENLTVDPKEDKFFNCSHMHSSAGVLVKAPLYKAYIKALEVVVLALTNAYTYKREIDVLKEDIKYLVKQAKTIDIPKQYIKPTKLSNKHHTYTSTDEYGLTWYTPDDNGQYAFKEKPFASSEEEKLLNLQLELYENIQWYQDKDTYIAQMYDSYKDKLENIFATTGQTPYNYLSTVWDSAIDYLQAPDDDYEKE